MPILRGLMLALLEEFDSEVMESPEEEDVDGVLGWTGENHQRMELMKYLPPSGNLDPRQISLAIEASKYSASKSELEDDDNSGDADSDSKSSVRKLWIYAFTCLLDQVSLF